MLLAAAYALGLCSSIWLDWKLAFVVASNAFSVVYLIAAIVSLDSLDRRGLERAARQGDGPRPLVFLSAVATVAASFTALFVVVNGDVKPSQWQLLLVVLSIPLGWVTIHLMATFHYVHLYWRRRSDGSVVRGLDFPGGAEPGPWDFVYFAFVIAMSAQTADVSLSEEKVRRFCLMHSGVAYVFNTVLIAAAVNLAVGGS